MSNKSEIQQKFLEKVNIEELRAVMAELVMSMMTGKEVNKVPVQAQIEVPEPIYKVVSKVADGLDMEPDAFFSQMATEGLQNSLQTLLAMANSVEKEIQEEKQIDLEPPGDKSIQDLTSFMENFHKQLEPIKNIASQLEQLQKGIEDADSSLGDIIKDPKNTK